MNAAGLLALGASLAAFPFQENVANNDPLPPMAEQRIGSARWQFPSPVSSMTYTVDGKALLVCDKQFVHIVDATTGRPVRRFAHGAHHQFNIPYPMALSNDGKVAVSGPLETQIWDVNAGNRIGRFPGAIYNLNVSADGKIYSGFGHLHEVNRSPAKSPPPEPPGMRSKCRVWDAVTGKELPAFADGLEDAGIPTLSADGKSLAYWRRGSVHVVNVADGRERFKTEAQLVEAKLAFSPDSKVLAFGTRDGVTLLDAADGANRKTLRRKEPAGKAEAVSQVAFAADVVVAAFYEGNFGIPSTLGVWNVATGRETAQFEVSSNRFALNPDGKSVAVASGEKIYFHDCTTGQKLPHSAEQEWRRATISADGKTIATASDRKIEIWDRETGKLRSMIETPYGVASAGIELTPDGGEVIALSRTVNGAPPPNPVEPTKWQIRPKFWDTRTGKPTRDVDPIEAPYARFATPDDLSADRKVLAVGDDKGMVRLLEFATAKIDRIQLGTQGTVTCVALGGQMLAAGVKNEVILYDLAARRESRRVRAKDEIGSVALSPDARFVATTVGHGHLAVWHVETGKRVGDPQNVTAAAFAPGGKTLALAAGRAPYQETQDYVIQIFDVSTMRPLHALRSHFQEIQSLRFAADSSTLVSSGRDGTAVVWNLAGKK